MASITNGYVTLAEAKARLEIEDNDNDLELINLVEHASRAVDRVARRKFWVDSADVTRYYTATDPALVWIDDLVSITSLATDDTGARSYGNTWASTDYDLWPENASAKGEPYMVIQITPNGRYRFPNLTRGVRVVGKFGVPSTSPWVDDAKGATLAACAYVWKMRHAPSGIAGSPALGTTNLQSTLTEYLRGILTPPLVRLFN